MIDNYDREILAILQGNARTSNAEIARRVGVAPSCVFERIRKLEARGIIKGYDLRLDPSKLGLGLVAFVFIRSDECPYGRDTAQAVAKIPQVQEVFHIAGEDCFLVKVRAPDTDSLGRLLREEFGNVKSIRSTRTTIVLETIKDSSRLPLPDPANPNHATPNPINTETARA